MQSNNTQTTSCAAAAVDNCQTAYFDYLLRPSKLCVTLEEGKNPREGGTTKANHTQTASPAAVDNDVPENDTTLPPPIYSKHHNTIKNNHHTNQQYEQITNCFPCCCWWWSAREWYYYHHHHIWIITAIKNSHLGDQQHLNHHCWRRHPLIDARNNYDTSNIKAIW